MIKLSDVINCIFFSLQIAMYLLLNRNTIITSEIVIFVIKSYAAILNFIVKVANFFLNVISLF